VTLPPDYVRQHVRLGYAATEHGYESDTVTAGIELASAATTRRGLYVAVQGLPTSPRWRAQDGFDVMLSSAPIWVHRRVQARAAIYALDADRDDLPPVVRCCLRPTSPGSAGGSKTATNDSRSEPKA
jgi:hypothetical protein